MAMPVLSFVCVCRLNGHHTRAGVLCACMLHELVWLCPWRRYQLTSWQEGQVVSASLLGALAGSAAAFVVGDKLGRKRELQLGAALYGARVYV